MGWAAEAARQAMLDTAGDGASMDLGLDVCDASSKCADELCYAGDEDEGVEPWCPFKVLNVRFLKTVEALKTADVCSARRQLEDDEHPIDEAAGHPEAMTSMIARIAPPAREGVMPLVTAVSVAGVPIDMRRTESDPANAITPRPSATRSAELRPLPSF